MTAKTTIELIKERLSITNIIAAKIKLKKVGNRLTGLCPYHKEKTPSFSVNEQGKFYYCFGCGESGDIIDFVSKTEGLPFTEALNKLAAVAGIELPKNNPNNNLNNSYENFSALEYLLEKFQEWTHKNLYSEIGRNARKYLLTRTTDETIRHFKLGYCPLGIADFINSIKSSAKENKTLKELNEDLKKSGIIDVNNRCYFSNRIIFPIFNHRNNIIAMGSRHINEKDLPKYLNSPETILFKKGEVLFGLNFAKAFCQSQLIIVEGYMDVIALYHHGYANSVGILGTSITIKHLEKLFTLSKELIFCFDGDTAGLKAADRAMKIILGNFINNFQGKIKFIFLPEGKDPDQILNENKQIFKFLLEKALLLSEAIFYLNTVNSHNGSEGGDRSVEDYLNLEQKLNNDYLAEIKEYSVKKHFQDFFRKEISTLKYKSRTLLYKKENDAYLRPSSTYSYGQSLKLIASANSRASSSKQGILLQIALKFPELLLFQNKQEYFANLHFEDKDLRLLHEHIINFINLNSNFNSELNNNISSSNSSVINIYFEKLKQYFENNISLAKTYQDFIRNSNNYQQISCQEKAQILWQKVTNKLEIEQLQSEYKNLLIKSMEDENILALANNILVKINELGSL